MTSGDIFHKDREGPRAAVNACPPRDRRGGRETLHGRSADWNAGWTRETRHARGGGGIMIHDTGAGSAAGKGVYNIQKNHVLKSRLSSSIVRSFSDTWLN